MAALLAALSLPAAAALAAIPVAYPKLLGQVRSAPLGRAVINPGPRHVEIKFRDGTEWEAVYPASGKAALLRLLHARRIPVVFAAARRSRSKTASGHVRLRYLAAGAVGALVVLGGAYLYRRRRREPASRPP